MPGPWSMNFSPVAIVGEEGRTAPFNNPSTNPPLLPLSKGSCGKIKNQRAESLSRCPGEGQIDAAKPGGN